MRSSDVRLVIGTRPEAIKLTPVADALAERGLVPRLVVTGQHRGLDLADYGLEGFDRTELNCVGMEDPDEHARNVEDALSDQIAGCRPDLLIVQGDTSSGMGAARAGFRAGVPVAHVEAGLRSHDLARPWPEEGYRIAIDAGAALLFAPTAVSARNLAAEKVAGEVHVTGNTGIDALLRLVPSLPPPLVPERGVPRILVTCHRRESWGEGVRSIAAALDELAQGGSLQIDVILPPNTHVAATLRDLLGHAANVALLEPCSHRDLIGRMREADLILSDSGGMQEEAPTLGIPLLVLRDKTERPEGIGTGNLRLVGTSAAAIVAETRRLLADPRAYAAMSRPAFPYGDGKAAPRVAAIIDAWLGSRSGDVRQCAPTSPREQAADQRISDEQDRPGPPWHSR
ncbi:MAG TPA: UDP-N-acetylglucosamine 2-epimerase (non-hydrolyzing), partial [Sphingomicrobium sp.]|nr:UDP-N-acetylglucosamine 2-epimerase (non-hydrolyzing) [Sphingomicrobium sp.]